MCRTTSWSPHFRLERWAVLDSSWDSSLFPRMKHCQPTQRGCVGRQEGTHAHSPLVKWTNSELPEDLFVSVLLIFLWSLWETAGILRVVLLWCNWYEDNLNEVNAGLLIFSVWIPTRWRCWVLHAWFCWGFFSLSLQPFHHCVNAIWQIFRVSHNDMCEVTIFLIGPLWNYHRICVVFVFNSLITQQMQLL